jgi:CheY-like chemotaxis protein
MERAELPRPHSHRAQFYESDRFLLSEGADYLGEALASGDSAIAVATRTHRAELEALLAARGFDLGRIRDAGRWFSFDAETTLAKISTNGLPTRTAFYDVVGAAVSAASHRGRLRVRAFGEMVGLLSAAGRADAAFALEELWVELLAQSNVEVLCAYPLAAFARAEDEKMFQRICALHPDCGPTERYLELGDERARLHEVTRLQHCEQVLLRLWGDRPRTAEPERRALRQDETPAPGPASDSPREAGQLRVLSVENGDAPGQSPSQCLEWLGHRVTVAGDGPHALAAIRRDVFDLILVDIGLPGMTGPEFAQRLRSSTAVVGTRLVALSTADRKDDRRRAREAGFHQHVLKPVTAEFLGNLCAEIVSQGPPPVESIT